ncbi:MAG: TetR/AcrR family transcriptional regulator [Citrobacter freundii]|nr:MAG: TetR/AcrR family transcriptional regulator [Citrobacter freundii]
MRIRDVSKEELVKKRAIMVLGKEGFEGFSMNKLAKACDISVATLYIYYKDKDDLIVAIAIEQMAKMNEAILKGFDPSMSFAEGLRTQWKNRASYVLAHPEVSLFFEQLRSSTYHGDIFPSATKVLSDAMGSFMKNAVKNKEIDPMPVEVFWSIAYGPLYTLLRFSHEGRSIGGRPFAFSWKILWETFDRVLMALTRK